jgi:hypothetical protein
MHAGAAFGGNQMEQFAVAAEGVGPVAEFAIVGNRETGPAADGFAGAELEELIAEATEEDKDDPAVVCVIISHP